MYACMYVPPRASQASRIEHPSSARSVTDTLVRLARDFSPRIEVQGDNLVMLDTSGLGSMYGDARAVGDALRRAAADHGLCARVAVATTQIPALLTVLDRAGLTMIPPGLEAASLASLPLDVLRALAQVQAGVATTRGRRPGIVGRGPGSESRIPNSESRQFLSTRHKSRGTPLALPTFTLLSTVRRWGLKTLGDLAALPAADLFGRLGAGGLALQRLARGEDERPLVPDPVEERLEVSLALDWPIEGLEPLSLVLSQLFDALCARLERGQVGAVVLHVRLWLVTREIHTRTLQLPAPLRDPRVLRTLVLLDLESHPPSAGIDRVAIVVDPAPARVLQCSLLERALSSPEQMSTLLARLAALMGEGRCGAPAVVDSHRPGAFEMRPFAATPRLTDSLVAVAAGAPQSSVLGPHDSTLAPRASTRGAGRRRSSVLASAEPVPGPRPLIAALRRFRFPVTARVTVDRGRPVRVATGYRSLSGRVVMCAGPWRTSGHWWAGRESEVSRTSREDQRSAVSAQHATSVLGPHCSRLAGSHPRALAPRASALGASHRHSSVLTSSERSDSPHSPSWDRDEWEVALTDGGVYRIYRDRRQSRWFVEGVVD